jgi:hypothetical protein
MDNSFVEKRRYRRYDVKDFVVGTLSNRLGHLMNISESGLALHFYNEDIEYLIKKEFKTSLLIVGKGFWVKDLPIRLVRKEVKLNSTITIIAAEFNTHDNNQLCKIKEYISGLS